MKEISLIALVVCLLLIPGCHNHRVSRDKVQMLDGVIDGLEELSLIAKSVDVTGKLTMSHKNEITGVVEGFESTETISMFARACWEMSYPMKAGDRQCDEVLDFAFWACVTKIAERTDNASVLELENMSQRYGQDGGASLSFKAALESQANRAKPGYKR